MKHFKLFFALFAMLALGVGNTWGAEKTYTFTSKSWEDSESAWTSNMDGNQLTSGRGVQVTKAASGASATSKNEFNNVSKVVVVYSTNASSGAGTIDIQIGSSSKKSYTLSKTGGTTDRNAELTFSPEESGKVKLTVNCTTNSIYVKSITIVTTASGGGSGEPVVSLTADPTTIDFGTVYKGATVADKTVAVNFANLTGAVTYSGLSTPFTATGAISATGDKITISADASTIGEYSQTLTVASTADSKTAEVTVKMNVVEKPAPTGTFTLHTGDLIEGDYVIVSTNALKAEVNSERLASLPVTISGNDIVDPDATTIWHIAKNGEYWTLYNANKAKYAASTGAKNKAALLDAGTDDKALWSVTGTSTYEFVNKKNTAAEVNANLRYNSQNAENSRWACYSTGTGAALSLYRKAGAKYNVTVNPTTNGTVTADPTSAEAGTTITLTVTPDGGYVLDALTVTDASSNTIEVADNKFTMPAADVTIAATFKLNEKPAATLTLSMNGETEDITGYKQDDKVTLPETIDNDCIKAFVGWSANPACSTEPEYAPGDEYTLTATTQTLYAVYADENNAAKEEVYTFTSFTQANTVTIDAPESFTIQLLKGSASTAPQWNAGSSQARIYAKGSLVISAETPISKIVYTYTVNKNNNGVAPTIDGVTGETNAGTWNSSEKTWTGNDTEVTFSTSGTAGNIGFTKVAVTVGGVSYSNYSTTCSAALTAPTFSLAAGTYNEAKEVTLSAEEGTIYYTLDGTTPTAESEEYTEAIVLDECGTTTIKAIAISGENSSPVAAATYIIQLPIPANDAENPYTAEEAIEVYNGGCYDNQEVYVTGVVETAQFYGNSGSYTITLEGGFKFYKFYADADETKFTEDYIVAGDTLVACGKLVLYNTTYELAEGCYLVDRKAYSAPKVDISNTPETAYTVAEAIALIDNVTSDLTKGVYVKGQISKVESFNEDYGNITYWIQDEEGNKFECYGGLGLNQAEFTSINDLVVGSQVVVYGVMKKYNSIYEFNHSNYIVSLTLPSYTVTVTAENGTVEGADKYEHGTVVTLTATPASGYKFVNWTSGETVVSTENPYKFTVTADVDLVANFVKDQGTALDNLNTTVAPVKAIINGQLIIINNGVQYNAQGQVIK